MTFLLTPFVLRSGSTTTFLGGMSIAGCVKEGFVDLDAVVGSVGDTSSFFGRSCFLWLFRLGATGVGVASVVVGGAATVASAADVDAVGSASDIAATGVIV